MELKEYLRIIRKNLNLFLGVVLLVVLVSFGYFLLRPKTLKVALDFDVTRTGKEVTSEYQYDNFYRLQADDKFAETLVQWIKSPEMVAEILKKSGMEDKSDNLKTLTKFFSAEKVSPQVVTVSFLVRNYEEADRLGGAMEEALGKNIQNLNEEQNQENWFKLVKRGPIVRPNSFSPEIVLIISILFGVLLGFWIVMFKHYLE
jgi:capsular polysaccharide biosynthesis protein